MSTSPQSFDAQIVEGLITAHLAATFAGFAVYVHTIEHTEGVVLEDTGMIDSTPELDEEGAPGPMPENIPRDVVCVINTHLHFDHCGGNRLFPGVPIHVQRLELQGPYDPLEWVDFPGATYVEHDGAKVLIAEILAGEPADEFYDSKVKVLSEEIEHHVEEEEKRMEGLFAQARKAGLDMDALGEQLAARKAELTQQFETSGIPTPKLTTMEETTV